MDVFFCETFILNIRSHKLAEKKTPHQSAEYGNEEGIRKRQKDRRTWSGPQRRASILSLLKCPLARDCTESARAPGSCSAAERDLRPPRGDSCACSFSCCEDQLNVKTKMPSHFTAERSWGSYALKKYMIQNQMWQRRGSQKRGQARRKRTGTKKKKKNNLKSPVPRGSYRKNLHPVLMFSGDSGSGESSHQVTFTV